MDFITQVRHKKVRLKLVFILFILCFDMIELEV